MSGFESYELLALIGACGGLIAGLVGLAGGIFIVPALMTLYGTQAMGDAVAVSFFAVLFNSLSTSFEHWKLRGKEQFRSLIRGARWYVCGATVMALFVAIEFGLHKDAIPTRALAALQLLLAVCMLIPRAWYGSVRMERNLTKDTLVGSVVGGLSTLIGVGGGTYTIAYFLTHGREIKDCTLTANFVGIFIGLMSLLGYYGYLTFALLSRMAPTNSLLGGAGTTALILAGVITGPIGVRLQKHLPANVIKTMIVCMLAASSIYVMLFA